MPGTRYDASTKAKAIRLVCEHAGDYPTQWAAIRAVSGRLRIPTNPIAQSGVFGRGGSEAAWRPTLGCYPRLVTSFWASGS